MTATPTIVGLGEVLWDVFPDGPRFGGAPANFACTAAGVGGDTVHAAMVSAVGNDEPGRQALQALMDHAVDVQSVDQIDFQTGQVLMTLDRHGQATYEFASNTAWDHLEWNPHLKTLADRTDAVCFGTLGQRAAISATTIQQSVLSTPPESLRVFDVNLRPPFWTPDAVLRSMELANVLKLNDEELPVVAGLLQIYGDPEEILRQLMKRYSLKLTALTREANGSLMLSENGDLPGKPTNVVDTVGAGDAFTATMIVGLLANRTLKDLHSWAAEVAAYVCSQAGATPLLPWHLSCASATTIYVAKTPEFFSLFESRPNSMEMLDEVDRFEGTVKKSDLCFRRNHDFCSLHSFDWNSKRSCRRKTKRPVHPV